MSEVEKIVASLSEAQRDAMFTNGWRAHHIPSLTHARCRAALQAKMLVEEPMYSTRLTPLGLAVRNHLLKGNPDA